MLKKTLYSLAIFMGLVLLISKNCSAQQKTKAELKAEQEVLKSEMKSEDSKERLMKIEKLEAEPPKTSGVGSVDGIADNSKKILVETKSINKQVPEMYKRTIGETVDGITDVTIKKPSIDELTTLALTLTTQIKAVADVTSSVTGATADIKSASPMVAIKATKSLNYSKEALSLVAPELQMNLKVVNNLIATLKSSNNN